MSEREEKRGGAGCAIVGAVLLFVLLPVLYVLSIGPVALIVKNSVSLRWLGVIYYPLEMLAEYCGPLDEGVGWYIRLWTG